MQLFNKLVIQCSPFAAAPEDGGASAAATFPEEVADAWTAALGYRPTPTKLQARYGGAVCTGGAVLAPVQTTAPPTISFEPEDDALYCLVLVDPDAPSRKAPAFREYVHWVVCDLSGGDTAKGVVLAPYQGPAPPYESGLHRYVLLLYKQQGGRITVATHEAAKAKFGASRGGHSISGWADNLEMKLVAAEVFQAGWDETCDALHKSMGWTPPDEFLSPSQRGGGGAGSGGGGGGGGGCGCSAAHDHDHAQEAHGHAHGHAEAAKHGDGCGEGCCDHDHEHKHEHKHGHGHEDEHEHEHGHGHAEEGGDDDAATDVMEEEALEDPEAPVPPPPAPVPPPSAPQPAAPAEIDEPTTAAPAAAPAAKAAAPPDSSGDGAAWKKSVLELPADLD